MWCFVIDMQNANNLSYYYSHHFPYLPYSMVRHLKVTCLLILKFPWVSLPPWQPTYPYLYFQHLQDEFQYIHLLSEILRCLCFCAQLISLAMMSLRFICCCKCQKFPLLKGWIVFYCVYASTFSLSIYCWWTLRLFHCTAMHTRVHMCCSHSSFSSLGCRSEMRLLGPGQLFQLLERFPWCLPWELL